MKHEKMMRAIGEIDDQLVKEAREKQRAKQIWIRFAACAACVALIGLAVPTVLKMVGAGSAAEMDQVEAPENMGQLAGKEDGGTDVSAETSAGVTDEVGKTPAEDPSQEAPAPETETPAKDQTAENDATVETDAPVEAEKEDSAERDAEAAEIEMSLELLVMLQGGAHPMGATIEREHGKATVTERTETTVTLEVVLLKDMELSVVAPYSYRWGLTVNGVAADSFPNKADSYTIEIDISKTADITMILVERFGVFSVEK